MSRSIDWSTTLVVPVPANVGSVQEVPVRGTTGYVIKAAESSPNGRESVVFWQANGVLYAVTGNLSAADLVDIAEEIVEVSATQRPAIPRRDCARNMARQSPWPTSTSP